MRWPIVFLFLLMPLIASCDPMTTVTFVNGTSQKLAFYVKTDVQAALLGSGVADPQSSVEEWTIAADYVTLRVAATREDGRWVFDQTYTRDDLAKLEQRVVVSTLEPIAPPAGVRMIPTQGAPPPVVPPITLVNETQETLEFYTKSDVAAALAGTVSAPARSSQEWSKVAPNFAWLRVAATREDGQWVFDHTYTWDELREAERRIVISSLEPIPPPANVKVIPSPNGTPPVLPSARATTVS